MSHVKSYLPEREHRILRAVVAARGVSVYAYVQGLLRAALRDDAKKLSEEGP